MNDLNIFVQLPELKKDYFSTKLNQILLRVLRNIFKDGGNVAEILDVYALVEIDVNDKKVLDEAGGLDHLETLTIISEDKSVEEVTIHANNIMECSYKNEMSEVLNGISCMIQSTPENSMEQINKIIEKETLETKSKYTQHEKIESLGSRLKNIMSNIRNNRQKDFCGYPTFSPTANEFYTYEKGEMVIVSAHAKKGKSQLITNEVYNLSILNKIPVLILDTELNDELFTVRLVSRVTGYNFNYIKSGLYESNPIASEKVSGALDLIENAPIFHQYIVGWSNNLVLQEVKRLKIRYNIQILFYDYIKMDNADENEHRVLGNITNFLKNDIAGSLKLAVVAFAQMSDYSNEYRLRMANSERMKNYASTVVFLVEKTSEQISRDFNELGGNYYLFIAYNRNGEQFPEDKNDIGININFNRGNATFSEAKYQHESIIKLSQTKYNNQ